MTSNQLKQYSLKWHRFQVRYEEIYTTKFKAALQAQVNQYLRNGNTQDVTSAPIYDVLTQLYKQVGPLWAQNTGVHRFKEVEVKARMPMGFSERIIELMRLYYGVDLLNDAELMTVESRKYIIQVLSTAAELGSSFDEIVKELRTNPNFTAMRARRIARTETVTAANGAAIVNAKESGNKMNKIWIAVRDKRTRHSHVEMDNIQIDINAAFDVSGNPMQQPGVRTLDNGLPTPANQVVNCRCICAFSAKRDKDGRLIRE